MQDAITRWNTRHDSQLIAELAEALRSIVDAYDRSKHEPSAPSAISVIRTAVESSRVVLASTCPQFSDGLRTYCDGDEPDNDQRYCNQCRREAERVRTAAEDELERRVKEGSYTREARVECERVVGLCEEVLGA